MGAEVCSDRCASGQESGRGDSWPLGPMLVRLVGLLGGPMTMRLVTTWIRTKHVARVCGAEARRGREKRVVAFCGSGFVVRNGPQSWSWLLYWPVS